MPSAVIAYRKDLEQRGTAFGTHDGSWVLAATLAEEAGRVGADAEWLLAKAARVAAVFFGGVEARRLAEREWGAGCSRFDALVLLAGAMHDAGAFHLAAALLDASLSASSCLTDVQRGRLLAARARVACTLGHVEVAHDLYQRVETVGRRVGNDELRVRGWIGLSTLAQVSGNFPQALVYSRRAARYTDRLRLRRLGQVAHFGVALATAKRKQFHEALIHAWAMYTCTRGDLVGESESLATIGQLLLESGEPRAAQAAFARVLTRKLSARIILAALGGFAVASARLGDGYRAALDWAVAEVGRARHSAAPRHSYVEALVECVSALVIVSRLREAERLRQEAVRLASLHKFPALAREAERIDTMPWRTGHRDSRRFKARAIQVVQSVHDLEPARLPRHARFVTLRPRAQA